MELCGHSEKWSNMNVSQKSKTFQMMLILREKNSYWMSIKRWKVNVTFNRRLLKSRGKKKSGVQNANKQIDQGSKVCL